MQGSPAPTDLWGKLRVETKPGGPAWHPLIDHCTDVACVMEALLAQPTIQRRLARAGQLDKLDEVQRARLCFLAFIHDLGKCSRGFRLKAVEGARETCGHIEALKPLLDKDEGFPGEFLAAIDADTLNGWSEVIRELMLAVAAHHGAPADVGFNATRDAVLARGWQRSGSDEPFAHLRRLTDAGRELFADAFRDGAALPTAAPFQHLFAGLLMFADWLGSGDTPAMFPYSEGREPRADFARSRAAEVVASVGLDSDRFRRPMADPLPSFEAQFGRSPRPAQATIDTLPLPAAGSLTLIESETGSGKTEAAFRWATRLLAAGLVDGVYFAVPLRSAAVQLQRRMQDWLDRTLGLGTAEALLAVPGYYRMGEAEGMRLPDFAVQWTDDLPEDRRLTRWAAEHPKRFLAGAFAVGTIDQALLGVLRVKHAHLRAACLVRHLLVMDEVHSSDPYMRRLVLELVELFRLCGGHVMLMSATLGAETRTLLYTGERALVPPEATCAMVPYPAVWTRDACLGVDPDGRRKRVEVDPLALLDAPEAIAARAAGAVDQGAKVLVLRNTVSGALAVQEQLEAVLGLEHPAAMFRIGDVVTLHHGRFAAEDRRLLDRAIEEHFGEGSAAGPAVVAATQTIEQSLDVDFDLLITDPCPIDVLLQRIGRLHRHARSRPAGFDVARCVILTPNGGDLTPMLARSRHGLGKDRAYPDLRAVAKTLALVGDGTAWTIPDDNRRLVEAGTHPDALRKLADELVATYGAVWAKHSQEMRAASQVKNNEALSNLLNVRKPFGDLFPSRDKIKIKTRLGIDDLLLSLSRPISSPFSGQVERLRVPGWMVEKAAWEALAGRDAPILEVLDDDSLALGAQRFTYDRRGLQRA